jgi:hypothetical protein
VNKLRLSPALTSPPVTSTLLMQKDKKYRESAKCIVLCFVCCHSSSCATIQRFPISFRAGNRVRQEIRVRLVGRGGNERLADEDDDTACPKRQPKHHESENNKQEWMKRSALPAGLCKRCESMVEALAKKCEEMCNPVTLMIPEKHLQAVRRRL